MMPQTHFYLQVSECVYVCMCVTTIHPILNTIPLPQLHTNNALPSYYIYLFIPHIHPLYKHIHTLQDEELQALACEIVPVMLPESTRYSCLKCTTRFNPPFTCKFHCKSCGDLYVQ